MIYLRIHGDTYTISLLLLLLLLSWMQVHILCAALPVLCLTFLKNMFFSAKQTNLKNYFVEFQLLPILNH